MGSTGGLGTEPISRSECRGGDAWDVVVVTGFEYPVGREYWESAARQRCGEEVRVEELLRTLFCVEDLWRNEWKRVTWRSEASGFDDLFYPIGEW
jgi:hypothetical protein